MNIKTEQRIRLYDISMGDTFVMSSSKHVFMKVFNIHYKQWTQYNVVNMSTGSLESFKEDSLITPIKLNVIEAKQKLEV